jgi:hypothetical protein
MWSACASGVATAACPRTCANATEDFVWTTLVNGNSVNITTMALTNVLSVRLFSCYKHVSLVTPEVREKTRALLRAAGSDVREVPVIRWPRQPRRVIDAYSYMFSKLHLWRPGAVGHARAAYLDADSFLTSPAADRLATACSNPTADLCAGLDLIANTVQGGLLVVRPSAARFRGMVEALAAWDTGVARSIA